MAMFSQEVIDAARNEREVRLTTHGRKSAKAHHVTIWVSTDGSRLFARSGAGLGRHWPQNLMAKGEGTLELGGRSVRVRPRHITDPEEARAVSRLHRDKYGSMVKPSQPGEPLTTGEQATFELLPA